MVLAGDEQGYAPASLLESIDGSSSADDDTFNDQGPSICPFVCLSVCMCMCLSVCACVCLYVHVSVCLVMYVFVVTHINNV